MEMETKFFSKADHRNTPKKTWLSKMQNKVLARIGQSAFRALGRVFEGEGETRGMFRAD
jgi:hypothetical protein